MIYMMDSHQPIGTHNEQKRHNNRNITSKPETMNSPPLFENSMAFTQP